MTFRWLLFLFAIGWHCYGNDTTIADFESRCFERNLYYRSTWGKATWPKLREVLRASKTPEDADKTLEQHEDFSRFYSSYVLMSNSESSVASAVDPKHPRRILFEDGIIFARTCARDPKLAAINQIFEVIHYDFKEKNFLFRQVDTRKTPPEVLENPKNCKSCHGDPPRPIWSSYRNWPGAINDSESYAAGSKRDLDPLKYSKEMGVKYEYFANRAEANGKRLLTSSLKNLKGTQWVGAENTFHFGMYVNALNFDRMAHQMMAIDSGKYRFAIIGALHKCPKLEEFLPEEERKRGDLSSDRLTSLQKDTKNVVEQIADAKDKLVEKYGGSVDKSIHYRPELQDVPRVSALRWLLEKKGFDIGNYSTDIAQDVGLKGYGFHIDGGDDGGIAQLACYLLPEVAAGDSDLKKVMLPKTSKEVACDILKKKSLDAFNLVLEPAPRPREKKSSGQGRVHE